MYVHSPSRACLAQVKGDQSHLQTQTPVHMDIIKLVSVNVQTPP
jgi:hypothetical protein